MTEQGCIHLINGINSDKENIIIIKVDEVVDIALIPSYKIFDFEKDENEPIKYIKFFLLKFKYVYVGCFFANTANDEQTDLQFYILPEYRKKINYIDTFNRYVFPSLFIDYEKIKISFKNEKIKNKLSQIKVLEKLKKIKGLKVTIKKSEVKHLLLNDFSYLNVFYKKLDKELNKIKIKLNKLLMKFDLLSIIKNERFSNVEETYIIYYYGKQVNIKEVINLHIRAIELYFILKTLK